MTGWKAKKLGDVLEKIEGGGTPSKDVTQYWGGDIPWASVKDIVTHHADRTIDYITMEGLKNSSSRVIEAGTLITPTRMALGHAVFFSVDVAINQDLKALYPTSDLDKIFLQYWFEQNKGKIQRIGVGSTVAGIQLSELRSLKFNLPEKTEQQRIAAILKLWDSCIRRLRQKIILQERLKKGFAQQLLTGKRRLDGFNAVWTTIRLAELGTIVTGSTPAMAEKDNYAAKGTCWATAEDFKGKYISNTLIKLSPKGANQARLLPKGSVLVTCIASIGKNAIAAVPLAANQQINAIIFNSEYSNEFFYYLISLQTNLLKRYAGAGAVPILNKTDFSKLKLRVPQDKEEQLAIANILSNADSVIALFKSELALVSKQKKYLLKNLITGAIRTPENLTMPSQPRAEGNQ